MFSKVIKEDGRHPQFLMKEGFLFTKNWADEEVLCIPRTSAGRETIPQLIIQNAHETLGHFGHRKTIDYIR